MEITGVLETCLYAEDLERAEAFYVDVLGLEPFARSRGRHVFFRCGTAVFLVFNPDATSAPAQGVPAHGARGPGHVCFAIGEDEVDAWRARFLAHGVAIEAEMAWPRGGVSLYVRDPAGNCVEVGPPGIWGIRARSSSSP